MDESVLVQACTSEMQLISTEDAEKSSNISDVLDQENEAETLEDELVKSMKHKKGKLVIFDSDEEDSPIQEEKGSASIQSTIDNFSDSSNDITIKKKKKILKRPLQDFDNDSSDDENSMSVLAAQGFDKKKDILQSESDETSQGIFDEGSNSKKSKKVLPKSPDTEVKSNWKSSLNEALFSDGDSSDGEKSFSLEDIKKTAKSKFKLAEGNKRDSNSAPRKSKGQAKTSKDELQEIHSETQRMVRTSAVCLPYHKPRQRSLTDFLNRKRVTPNSNESLKPRLKDYNTVVQVLEDRAKEVETFFKSDSEESGTENGIKEAYREPDELEKHFPANDELTTEGNEKSVSEKAKKTACSEESLHSNDLDEIVETHLKLDKEKPSVSASNIEGFQQEPNQDLGELKEKKEATTAANSPGKDDENPRSVSLSLEDHLDDEVSLDTIVPIFNQKDKIDSAKRLSIAKVSVPVLHGRPGELLDLDEGDSSTPNVKDKVNSLIERFVEQVTSCTNKKSPLKKDIEISIVKKVTGPDGQLELKTDVVKVTVGKEKDSNCASAARRQLLKDSLRQSISAKRAADRIKWVKNEGDEEENEAKESEEEILSDEEESDLEEDEDDNEDDRLYKEKRKRQKSMFVDEEADESDKCSLNDDASDEEEDEPKKERVAEADDEDGSKDSSQSRPQVSANKRGRSLEESGHFSSLEDLTPNLDGSDGESSSETKKSNLIAALPSTQPTSESNFDELLALCSGKFTDAKEDKGASRNLFGKDDQAGDMDELEVKSFSRIIPMTQDDDDDDVDDVQMNFKLVEEEEDLSQPGTAPSFLDNEERTKRKKGGKRNRLNISDDEEDNESEGEPQEEDEMHEEEKEFRGLNEFFEDEAELSGSEVGSGDEREDGEDDWEEEEGDKEDLDENEVREQVERAHFKTLLDQDQRDVRLFQELFLEDGDLHSDGGGRQRQFRWRDAEGDEADAGTSIAKGQDEEEEDAGAEDQDDLTWRKLRSEREKWLQQQKTLPAPQVNSPIEMKRNGRKIRVNPITKVNPGPSENMENPAVPSLTQKKELPAMMIRRGSFLRRSDKDLSAIATLTKSVLPVQAPKNGNNFVFASITPERPTNTVKRKNKKEEPKGDDLPSSSVPPAKKPKISLNSKSIFSYF